jgi:hypothetical protein
MPYSIKDFANIKKDYYYFLSLIQSFAKHIRNIQKLIPSRVIYCKTRLIMKPNMFIISYYVMYFFYLF